MPQVEPRLKVSIRPPVKHQRYPGDAHQDDFVTIIAGYRCIDGVILTADTRLEEGNVKYREGKVFSVSKHPDTAVALTGSGDFESVSTCADLLRTSGLLDIAENVESPETVKTALRTFMESRRYSRVVKAQTNKHDGSVSFDLMIAIQTQVRKVRQTDLVYIYGEDKLYPIQEYKCSGSGSDTAIFLSKWLWGPSLPVDVFAPLLIQIMAAVKGHHAGCDGETKLYKFYNHGAPEQRGPDFEFSYDSPFLWGLHALLKPIILGCANHKVSDTRFEESLKLFIGRAREIRAKSDPTRVAQQDPESTKGDSSIPQPSPE